MVAALYMGCGAIFSEKVAFKQRSKARGAEHLGEENWLEGALKEEHSAQSLSTREAVGPIM